MGIFDLFKKSTPAPSAAPTQPPKPAVRLSVPDGVTPIEKRIRGTVPTCDSLYPHEVLVLSYAERYKTADNDFPRFWLYEYGIRDVQSILWKLVNMGLVRVGTTEEALSKQRVTDLKEILQSYNLGVSGKKADLIQRVIENVPADTLNSMFPVKPYKLTLAGESLLKKYEWIPYIHFHKIEGLDIWTLTKMVQTPPYTKFRDTIWGYFNKISSEYIYNWEIGPYSSTRIQMAQFLIEEHKEEAAFRLFCEVIAYDLSGLTSGLPSQLAENANFFYPFFFPYEGSIITVPPGIIQYIKELSDNFLWSEESLVDNLRQNIYAVSLPYSIFTADEKVEIVMAEITKDSSRLDSIYNTAAKRFKKQFKVKK